VRVSVGVLLGVRVLVNVAVFVGTAVLDSVAVLDTDAVLEGVVVATKLGLLLAVAVAVTVNVLLGPIVGVSVPATHLPSMLTTTSYLCQKSSVAEVASAGIAMALLVVNLWSDTPFGSGANADSTPVCAAVSTTDHPGLPLVTNGPSLPPSNPSLSGTPHTVAVG